MKRIKVIVVLLTVSFFAGAQESDSAFKPVEYPAGFRAQLNLVYTTVKDWEGKMDLYLPPKQNGKSPVVINIHGGGWNHGVKESQSGFNTFFKMGYAVANIEYRLTAQATAPAAIEDTRCALIYLIRHAADLNIDINKIVVMGGSSGGHLALMAGLLGDDHRFNNHYERVEHIKVAAIIDQDGIIDETEYGYGNLISSKSATN